MIIYNRTEYKALSLRQYSKEKKRLQVELLKLEEWVIKHNKRIAVVMEGRDAAGKGSTIKRFVENMMPKAVEVIHAHLVHGDPDDQFGPFAEVGHRVGWFRPWRSLNGLRWLFRWRPARLFRHLPLLFFLFPHAVLHEGLFVHFFSFRRLFRRR